MSRDHDTNTWKSKESGSPHNCPPCSHWTTCQKAAWTKRKCSCVLGTLPYCRHSEQYGHGGWNQIRIMTIRVVLMPHGFYPSILPRSISTYIASLLYMTWSLYGTTQGQKCGGTNHSQYLGKKRGVSFLRINPNSAGYKWPPTPGSQMLQYTWQIPFAFLLACLIPSWMLIYSWCSQMNKK